MARSPFIDTGLVVDEQHRPHPWFADHVMLRKQDEDPLGQGSGAADAPGYLAHADGHGTFVTGLILREAPRIRVIMFGVLDKSDLGSDAVLGEREDVLVAQAIRALAHHPDVKDIKVVNLSFGGAVFTDEAANLESALDELDPGIAVVAAAGNDGNDNMVWPAAFAVQRKDPERLGQVISVGALDERRLIPAAAIPPRAAFSNYGPWVTAYAGGVQVLGPFVDYYETGRDDFGLRPPQHYRGWARWSGTSFAAAKVSGRIAQTAVALDKTGAEAAQLLLADAPKIDEHDAVWIRATP